MVKVPLLEMEDPMYDLVQLKQNSLRYSYVAMVTKLTQSPKRLIFLRKTESDKLIDIYQNFPWIALEQRQSVHPQS